MLDKNSNDREVNQSFNSNTFIKRLKHLLDDREMSQKEIADLIGVSEVTISRYMTGERMPRVGIIRLLAINLNVSTDYLLGCSNIKNPYKETKLKPEYYLIAKEMQDVSIDIEDIRSIMNIIKRNRKYK